MVVVLSTARFCYAQDKYNIIAVGFYNVENLFDTHDDTAKKDEDFTPKGSYHYTDDVYRQKLHNIATVISQMGTDKTADGPAILGLAEVENSTVLQDLISQPEIAGRKYEYKWYYTSDERGISTAMLYNPKYFTVIDSRPLVVPLEGRPTRDVLYVCGILVGDTIHILVNHWPSKMGGAAATDPLREIAAKVNRQMVDSITAVDADAKILIMGDLNDNPDCNAIVEVLGAKGDRSEVQVTDMYNPWFRLFRKGIGTENYKGEWGLLDQIIISHGLLGMSGDRWRFYNVDIFNKSFMTNQIGDDKGTPHRSFSASHAWDNGYSDHYPVLMYLVEKSTR